MADQDETKALSTEKAPAMPPALVRRGIDESSWRALMNIFPGCAPDSVLLVWDYCKARRLDPMKKPCHIVPMKVKVGGEYVWRDVVMPGIYEYRITAHRTGLYLGHTKAEYGPMKDYLGVQAPEWCDLTVFRKVSGSSTEKSEFPVRIFFSEVVATKDEWKNKEKTGKQTVNERWSRAPIQMLTKCTEAAALREAFPEEFGGEPTAEEMDGRTGGGDVIDVPATSVPADLMADYLADLPPVEQAQIKALFQAAKRNKGQTDVLLKKFEGNVKGLVAELTALIPKDPDPVEAKAEGKPAVEKVKPGDTAKAVVGKVINTPAEAKAVVEAPSGEAVFPQKKAKPVVDPDVESI